MHAYLALLATVAVTVLGDGFLKHAAKAAQMWHSPSLYIGLFLYGSAGIFFVLATRHMTLISFGIWYRLLTLMLVICIGALIFQERLSVRQSLGAVLAFASIALMSRHA